MCFLRKYNLSPPSAAAIEITGGELSSPYPTREVLLKKPSCVQHLLTGPCAPGSAFPKAGQAVLPVGDNYLLRHVAVKSWQLVCYTCYVRCCVEVRRQLQKLMHTGCRSPKHSARSCCVRRWSTNSPCLYDSLPIFCNLTVRDVYFTISIFCYL